MCIQKFTNIHQNERGVLFMETHQQAIIYNLLKPYPVDPDVLERG